MTTPRRRALADSDTLAQMLALLGRGVTVADGAPPGTTVLHLARTPVAATEQQAFAAEHALGKAGGGNCLRR